MTNILQNFCSLVVFEWIWLFSRNLNFSHFSEKNLEKSNFLKISVVVIHNFPSLRLMSGATICLKHLKYLLKSLNNLKFAIRQTKQKMSKVNLHVQQFHKPLLYVMDDKQISDWLKMQNPLCKILRSIKMPKHNLHCESEHLLDEMLVV